MVQGCAKYPTPQVVGPSSSPCAPLLDLSGVSLHLESAAE